MTEASKVKLFGIGVTLNSLAYSENYVKGYVFLAPDFGLHSNTERVSGASNFATICTRAFIVNAISLGLLLGHERAVRYADTPEEVKAAGLVQYYTVNMALALNAAASATDLAHLNKPFGLWIGSNDEVFDPAKVVAYAQQATKVTHPS